MTFVAHGRLFLSSRLISVVHHNKPLIVPEIKKREEDLIRKRSAYHVTIINDNDLIHLQLNTLNAYV